MLRFAGEIIVAASACRLEKEVPVAAGHSSTCEFVPLDFLRVPGECPGDFSLRELTESRLATRAADQGIFSQPGQADDPVEEDDFLIVFLAERCRAVDGRIKIVEELPGGIRLENRLLFSNRTSDPLRLG